MGSRTCVLMVMLVFACSGNESGKEGRTADTPFEGDGAVETPLPDGGICAPGTSTCDLLNADLEIHSVSPLADVVVTAGACRVVPGCLIDARASGTCTRVFAGGVPGTGGGAAAASERMCELTVTALDGRSTSLRLPIVEGAPSWVCCAEGLTQVLPRSLGPGVVEVTFDAAEGG